ncbi:MAG: DUF1080 domain-containing protein [Verrucomicrobiota bacterium]|jgi:hypothetical protein|nr:DUF1080 domain-containing protein [Verrucomicrobiota bacterium]MDP7049454.1 DUF1080 domain-containing protein [Verrucomicrobiota bacterium]
MKQIVMLPRFIVVLLTASFITHADENGATIKLFNGNDLSNWVVMGKQEGWEVKDGVIRSEGGNGGHWLRSKNKYQDFLFKVEWRVSKGGNSGVYIRSADKGQPWETGYEIQISNEPRDDLHCTGSLYGFFPVKPRPDESADKWHTFEIHCKGTKIKIIADGVTCVNADQAKHEKAKFKPLVGYVGLQDSHSPTGHYVEYRNVTLKALKK